LTPATLVSGLILVHGSTPLNRDEEVTP
jgi:hypothetical protein